MFGVSLLAGRRGDILWKKPSLLGAAQRRDYDTYEGWGWHYPFVLTRPIHVFDMSGLSPTAPAIPLRQDRGFAGAAYAEAWVSLAIFLGGAAALLLPLVAAFKWIEEKPEWLLFAVLAGVGAVIFVVGIVLYVRANRADRRHQDIRLLLGIHAWGSSDPAYWHTDVHPQIVRPAEAFGVPDYAAVARRELKTQAWARAMWAARLSCAVENQTGAEELTTEILEQPEVRRLLADLRKDPENRDQLLGGAIPLSTWVGGDPAKFVFTRILTGS